MAGMKIVYTFDQSILNRENNFYCLKELHCRRLVLVRFCLMIVVLLLFFRHIKKKWHNKIYQFTHVRDFYRLHLRYWIFLLKWTFNLVDFLSLKLSLICNLMLFSILKIQAFTKFVKDNHQKTKQRNLVYKDLPTFSDLLSMFLTMEFIDPKGMFRKICCQLPFEFLIMFDFCRQ